MGIKVGILDRVDHTQSIDGHEFTVDWLLESLRTNDKTYQRLHGHRAVQQVTAYDVSGGKGFVSAVLRCTVLFVDAVDPADVYTTVLKIPGCESLDSSHKKNELHDSDFDEALKRKRISIHNCEVAFYNEVAPMLRMPMPKICQTVDWVYGRQQGCIHMEDLTSFGVTLNHFETINLAQVRVMVKHLARMHKDILVADPRLWRGRFTEGGKFLANFINLVEKFVDPFLERSGRRGDFEPILNKYRKLRKSQDFIYYANLEAYKDLAMPPVLVHGDMHTGNIMWAIDGEGSVQNEVAAVVDWQIVHEGSPMSDMARFLTHCCDGVVRRQAEAFVFDYYLECLTKELGNYKVPYTLDQLKKAYNFSFLTQAFLSIGGAMFLHAAIADKIPNTMLRDAYFDAGVLKTLHIWQDADRILSGDLKDMYDKYGK